jgi:YfiR/HmsC-like
MSAATSSVRARQLFASVLAALLICTSTGRAQNVTEPSLKAAFIFNFARFTEWPQDSLPPLTFSACVLGDRDVPGALERIVKGRQLLGRAISVSEVESGGKLRSCQLLYMSGLTPSQVAATVAAVKGAPVLTISDADNFVQQGGIAQMFVEDGRMRFNLNLAVSKVSHLQLSSKLLALAAHVHDGPVQ